MPFALGKVISTARDNRCLIYHPGTRKFFTPDELAKSWETYCKSGNEKDIYQYFKLATPAQAMNICLRWVDKVNHIMKDTLSKIESIEDNNLISKKKTNP